MFQLWLSRRSHNEFTLHNSIAKNGFWIIYQVTNVVLFMFYCTSKHRSPDLSSCSNLLMLLKPWPVLLPDTNKCVILAIERAQKQQCQHYSFVALFSLLFSGHAPLSVLVKPAKPCRELPACCVCSVRLGFASAPSATAGYRFQYNPVLLCTELNSLICALAVPEFPW